jgi:hypothetical protein
MIVAIAEKDAVVVASCMTGEIVDELDRCWPFGVEPLQLV